MSKLLEYKIDLMAKTLGIFETVTAVSVMRRQQQNDDGSVTDVIDYYPAWRGAYGKFKLIHEYMNHDWQKERFAKYAGIQVDQIPLYDSDQSLIRKQARPHAKEIQLPNTIDLLVTCGNKEDETKKQILKFLGEKPQQPVTQNKPVGQVKKDAPKSTGTVAADEGQAKLAYFRSLDGLGKGACKAKAINGMAKLMVETAVFDGWKYEGQVVAAIKKLLGNAPYPSGSTLLDAKKRVLLVGTLKGLGERLSLIEGNDWKVTNEAIVYSRNLHMKNLEQLK